MQKDEKYISEYHGMELEPIAEPDKRKNENGILHYVKYLILKRKHGKLTNTDICRFQTIVHNLSTTGKDGKKIRGLYDRGKDESIYIPRKKLRLISHDNIKAISAFSRLLENHGLVYHKHIAEHGLKWQMRFDNAHPDKPRWIYDKHHVNKKGSSFHWHPRDWFTYLYNAGKLKWYNPFTWFCGIIFMIASIVSCLSPFDETSGKLLVFTTLECGAEYSKWMLVTKKICYWLLRKKYGKKWLSIVMGIYHGQDKEHPLNELSKDLEL
jgi:hypothetical protein